MASAAALVWGVENGPGLRQTGPRRARCHPEGEEDVTVGDYFKQFKDYKDPDNDPGGAGMAVS